MIKTRIFLVSAGLLSPKKTDYPAARKHRYLNYGLLTLGTILARKGYSIQLLHGGFSTPREVAGRLARSCVEDNHRLLLLLSLPSFLSLEWARQFLEIVKRECPESNVIVGGRWVVGNDGAWIRSRLPGVDLVVYGTADHRIDSIVGASEWRNIPGTDTGSATLEQPVSKFIQLDYGLDGDFPDFQPSIEVSRGCGMGCSFCEERLSPLGRLRDPDDVVAAVAAAFNNYETTDIRFYFEASFFRPTERWATELAESSKKMGLEFAWRCETRVDALSATTLRRVAEAGLRVVDLGLESASPRQLIHLNKTSNPQLYLRRASDLLHECRDNGIWAKVNVLLHPGETLETLAETTDWLDRHRECIKGVSVAPLTVYGHGDATRRYLEDLALLGASVVDPTSAESKGVTSLHLSSSIDYENSWALSRRLSRMFMGYRDYFDLKRFSYFSRSYTYPQFLRDLEGIPSEHLPFQYSPELLSGGSCMDYSSTTMSPV